VDEDGFEGEVCGTKMERRWRAKAAAGPHGGPGHHMVQQARYRDRLCAELEALSRRGAVFPAVQEINLASYH
jgi:hypothetical protein